jgi:hypothetical protein
VQGSGGGLELRLLADRRKVDDDMFVGGLFKVGLRGTPVEPPLPM